MNTFGNGAPRVAGPEVRHEIVQEAEAGRRLDNFLATRLRGLPRDRLYRSLRNGEVRVNGGRARQDYRLRDGDRVRIPPLRVKAAPPRPGPPPPLSVLYEDDSLLVVNKPSGWAVHGGSGLRNGLIEALKAHARPGAFLELAHRLDRETSGCLLLAKEARFLRAVQGLLREGRVEKRYRALLLGAPLGSPPGLPPGLPSGLPAGLSWGPGSGSCLLRVDLPLVTRHDGPGRRHTRVTPEGRPACSEFRTLEEFSADLQWVEVQARTGRTHQVRAHAAAIGRPVAGDDLYGDRELNRALRGAGLRRLFLHARLVAFRLPETGRAYRFEAPLSAELAAVLRCLRAKPWKRPPRAGGGRGRGAARAGAATARSKHHE